MPWVWFIITGSLCLVGSYWILSGQRAEPVDALIAWLSISPGAPVFGLPQASLGLPLAVQSAISFFASGLVGLSYAYLPHYRPLAAVLIISLWVRLIIWRATQALTSPAMPVTTVLSIMLLVFETLGLLLFLAWWYRHQSVKLPTPMPVLHRPTNHGVRVILQVDQEPIHLVNQSLQSALNLDWPTVAITVVDPRKRLDVAAICRKNQVDYWALSTPMALHDALNTVTALIDEPYVLLLKAGDLLPPEALMASMPYVLQENTTFVQMGQRQTHPDALQRNLKIEAFTNTPEAETQWLGYVADAAAGLVPFLASGTLIKHQALTQKGGFKKTWLKTGLVLQQGQKHKACYAPHITVLSYTPANFGDWITARLNGQAQCYSALKESLKPSTKNLRLFATGIQALHPWLRWGFWLIPLVSLYTGIPVLPASLAEIAMYYMPFLLALHFGYPVLTRQLTQYLVTDLYHSADCLLPVWPIPLEQLQRFRQNSFLHWGWVKTPLILAGITILGLFIGIARQWHAPEGSLAIFIVSLGWALYNLVLLAGVALIAHERRETRLMPRLNTPLRGLLTLPDNSMAVGQIVNLSESGLELAFDDPIPTVGAQTLTLLDWPKTTRLVVEPVHSVIEEPGRHYVGFRILRRPDTQRQQLIRHLCRALPPVITATEIGPMWGLLVSLPFWLQGRPEIANRRKMPRFNLILSAVLEHNQQYHVCFTQNISERGASVVLKMGHGITPGSNATLRLQWPDNSLSTYTVTILSQLPHLENDLLNMVFSNITDISAKELITKLYPPSINLVRVAPAFKRQINMQYFKDSAVRGLSLTLCEKGIVAQFLTIDGLTEGETLTVGIQWNDASPMCNYPMRVMAINEPLKQLMLYFESMEADEVMTISQAMAPPGYSNHLTPSFL